MAAAPRIAAASDEDSCFWLRRVDLFFLRGVFSYRNDSGVGLAEQRMVESPHSDFA